MNFFLSAAIFPLFFFFPSLRPPDFYGAGQYSGRAWRGAVPEDRETLPSRRRGGKLCSGQVHPTFTPPGSVPLPRSAAPGAQRARAAQGRGAEAINTYQECPEAPPVTNCPSGRRPCPGKSRLQQAGTGPRLVGHKVPAAASSGASLAATGILAVQSYQSNTASHGSSNTIVTSTRSSPLPSFTSILRMIRSGVIFPPAHTPGCLFPAGNNPQAPQNPGYPRCKQQMEPTPPLRIPATLPSCSQQPVWVRAQQRGCSSRLSSASRNPINC